MFTLRKPKEPKDPTAVEMVIANLISEMAGYDGHDEKYGEMSKNLKTLVEARAVEKAAEKPNTLSADTIAIVAGNLVGIILILGFERANVITSKALGFVSKPRT